MRTNDVGMVVAVELRLSVLETILVNFSLIFYLQINVDGGIPHIFNRDFFALDVSDFGSELKLQLIDL